MLKSKVNYLIVTLVCVAASVLSMKGLELSEMNVALLGDSNTWIGGDDCSKDAGWNYWFARKMAPRSIRSYARSGATWTHTKDTHPDLKEYTEVLSDNNVIFNQFLRLVADVDENGVSVPDIIIISAGTNDAWFPERRPDEFSKTASQALARDTAELGAMLPCAARSLAEAVRYDLYFIQNYFPEARVVVVTPSPSVKISAEMLKKVSDTIAQIAQGMETEVVRLDQLSPILPESEAVNRRYTTDGTHTSAEGARRHAEIITRALKSVQN